MQKSYKKIRKFWLHFPFRRFFDILRETPWMKSYRAACKTKKEEIAFFLHQQYNRFYRKCKEFMDDVENTCFGRKTADGQGAVIKMSKYHALWEYVQKNGRPSFQLTFDEIASIAGIAIDHSFLKYKKELTSYGYQVGKISMKEQTVLFFSVDKGQ